MRSEILFSQQEVATWVFNQLLYTSHSIIELYRGYFCAVGFTRYGKICGGIVWTKLARNRSDVEATYVGRGAWLTLQVGKFMTYVPFEVFGVAHVTARIPESCTRSIRLLERYGWKREGLQRKAYGGHENLVLLGMIREDADMVFKE